MKRRDFITATMATGLASGMLLHSPRSAMSEETDTTDPAPGDFSLLTPPILQWCDQSSATILVLTSHPAACHIELREIEAGNPKSPTRRLTNHQDGLIDANTTCHSIKLDLLKPNTEYEYVLVARQILKFEPYKVTWGAELRSDTFRLKTPDPHATEVRFTVLNDLHKNTALIHQLFEMVEQRKPLPQWVMLNGDVLSHIGDESDIRTIYDLPGSYASEHPMIWVRGNHECRGQFAREMANYLVRPDGRYYYTFRRGPVQMLVLDCGEDKPDEHWAYSGLNNFNAFREEEESWLRQVVESDSWKNAPWRVLVVHIPVEKGTLRPGSTPEEYRVRWAKLLEQAGLDLELTAHYHQVCFTEKSPEQAFPILVGGGPSEDSAVAFHVLANESSLQVEMTDVEGQVQRQMTLRH